MSSVTDEASNGKLSGVPVCRAEDITVEDITTALRGTRVSPSTVSELNQRIYHRIDEWRTRPIEREYPYVCLDGMWLKRSCGGEVRNVAWCTGIATRFRWCPRRRASRWRRCSKRFTPRKTTRQPGRRRPTRCEKMARRRSVTCSFRRSIGGRSAPATRWNASCVRSGDVRG